MIFVAFLSRAIGFGGRQESCAGLRERTCRIGRPGREQSLSTTTRAFGQSGWEVGRESGWSEGRRRCVGGCAWWRAARGKVRVPTAAGAISRSACLAAQPRQSQRSACRGTIAIATTTSTRAQWPLAPPNCCLRGRIDIRIGVSQDELRQEEGGTRSVPWRHDWHILQGPMANELTDPSSPGERFPVSDYWERQDVMGLDLYNLTTRSP